MLRSVILSPWSTLWCAACHPKLCPADGSWGTGGLGQEQVACTRRTTSDSVGVEAVMGPPGEEALGGCGHGHVPVKDHCPFLV